MSSDNAGRAAALLEQADKKLSSWKLFNPNKYQEAADYIAQAANLYKIDKNWVEASKCYRRAADICLQHTSQRIDAVQYIIEAAKCLRHLQHPDALTLYNQAARMHQEDNRTAQAGRLYAECAQFAHDIGQRDVAIENYTKAADCYLHENSTITAHSNLLKAADLRALKGEYKEAIATYERVAEQQLNNSSVSGSVPDYYFKALLCQMASECKSGNLSGVLVRLAEYVDMCPRLRNSKEERLITMLCDAFNKPDAAEFSAALRDYDRIYRLNEFTTSLLYEVKVSLDRGDEELLDLK